MHCNGKQGAKDGDNWDLRVSQACQTESKVPAQCTFDLEIVKWNDNFTTRQIVHTK